MGIIEETEEKLASLKLRLPELEGKANKRERTQVSKDIYALENGEAYVAAIKDRLEGGRAEAAAARRISNLVMKGARRSGKRGKSFGIGRKNLARRVSAMKGMRAAGAAARAHRGSASLPDRQQRACPRHHLGQSGPSSARLLLF